MKIRQCSICGETKFESWSYCPACGHPYPDADNPYEADDEWDPYDEDDPDDAGDDDEDDDDE